MTRKPSKKSKSKKIKVFGSERAIGLAELAVILAIVSTLVVGSLTVFKPSEIRIYDPQAVTIKRLNEIERKLADYSASYKRLPCPANPAYDNKSFVTWGHNGALSSARVAHFATENIRYTSTNKYICEFAITPGGTIAQIGAVPTATLGLPSEYQVDGWGRKFRYHVSPNFCGGVSKPCTPANYERFDGNLVVRNSSAVNQMTNAAYVLLSYGTKGYSTYNGQGVFVTDNPTSANELENINTDLTYINGPLSVNFNHLVRFKSKTQLAAFQGLSGLISASNCTEYRDMIARQRGEFFDYGSNSYNQIGASWGGFAAMVNPINSDGSMKVGFDRASNMVMGVMWSMQDLCNLTHGTTRVCPASQPFLVGVPGVDAACTCRNMNWSSTGC